jgi:hypothetical protein
VEPVLSLAVVAATLYSILRILLDAIPTSQHDQTKLHIEVLALPRQVQVLERQIKWVRGGHRPIGWCWPPFMIACRDLLGSFAGRVLSQAERGAEAELL